MSPRTTRAPALLGFAEACRRAGISTALALRADDFPPLTTVGSKRFVPREAFEAWLAEKTHRQAPAA